MSVNVELLEKTMQHLLDHPEQHDQQEVWTGCGTPGCFVGHAQASSGMDFEAYNRWVLTNTHDSIRWAADNLGIDYDEASRVFVGTNTIPMLQLMVKDLVNGTELKTCAEYHKEAHPDE